MTVVLDRNGAPITENARVVDGGTEIGTVIDVTEPDGDWNDELGRAVAVGPYVYVKYDGNDEVERWPCTWNATGPWDDWRDDYTCDDVEVAR